MITSIYWLAAETLEPAGAWLRPNISRPACQFTPFPFLTTLNKLVAVVTRARIVSELSVVILLNCEPPASVAAAASTPAIRAIPVPASAWPNQNRCLQCDIARPVRQIVLVPDESSMS